MLRGTPASFFVMAAGVPLGVLLAWAELRLPALVVSEVTGGQTFLHAALAVGALLALTFLAVGLRDFCKTILEAQESRYRFYLTSCLEEKSMAMFYQTYEKKQTRDQRKRAEEASYMMNGKVPLCQVPNLMTELIRNALCYALFGTILSRISPLLLVLLTLAAYLTVSGRLDEVRIGQAVWACACLPDILNVDSPCAKEDVSMDEMFAIKCQNCGGPMYSHQAKRSFECAYCETVIPWQADAGEPKSALGIRHTPLTVVDGLLKLTHVSQLERPVDPDWYFLNAYWRNQSVLEHLLWEDRGTAQEFQEATHVSIPCPFCGASFEGSSTQRVFECPSCGNKIGVADLLKPGTFSKRLTMGVGAEYVPEQGVPCEISPQQARANALQLVRQYPDAFAGHDVEDAIQNDMMLFYFPMALADLRMMASFPGKGLSKETLVYYEVLDWAYPRANYLDVRLMGILEPWDFGKVGPFDPAMQEGDFRVVSVDASTKDQVVIDKLALDVAGNDAEAVLGLNKKSIRAWARKARKHKDGLVMVPVYFVDRPASDSRDGERVRIAVNGQTGRAAAVVFSDILASGAEPLMMSPR